MIFFLCFFVFRFSFYCLHVLCYSHCIVTPRVKLGLYLQNGERIVTIDSVTSSHPMHNIMTVMGLLQLRFELDSSTIRVRFELDSATTRYEMRTIRMRFEHESYEELCAFEQ